jgi:hypothetical protein
MGDKSFVNRGVSEFGSRRAGLARWGESMVKWEEDNRTQIKSLVLSFTNCAGLQNMHPDSLM